MSRILIVMDDDREGSHTRSTLKQYGYEVHKVPPADRLNVDYYEKSLPDLVITDLALGNDPHAGLKVIAAVRDTVPSAKVVVCSDSADLKTIKTVVKWGACDYILKPFDPMILLDKVEEDLVNDQFPKPKRIMLIMRPVELLEPFLEILDHGYNVVAKLTAGESCVKRYQEVKPDLVITDLKLAGDVDGMFVISALRAADPDAKVLVCGREKEVDGEVLADIVGRGGCDFLVLPAKGEELLERVERCFSHKRIPVQSAEHRAVIAGRAASSRKALSDALKRNDFEIAAEADSGEDCLELWWDLKPSLVLVDTDLSGNLNAVDVVRAIRIRDPGAKVMLYSCQYPLYLQRSAFRAGACDCITLPIDAASLGAKINAHCGWIMQ